jgi:hypothetical protein
MARERVMPELEPQIDAHVFAQGPLAGLAIRSTSEGEFYEQYSEAAKRVGHEQPAGTFIADPNNPEDDALCEVLRALEHSTFYDLDRNTRDFLDNHYGSREPRSVFVGIFDYQKDPMLPMPASMARLDNTKLAKPTAEYKDVPESYVSVEDIPLWGVENIALTMKKSGIPNLRHSDEVTDVVTIGNHKLYTPKRAFNAELGGRIDVALGLYHEVVQLNRPYMVTILNKFAHKLLQMQGEPWVEYAGNIQPIKYDGPNSKFTSMPYYHDKAKYVERLRAQGEAGAAIIDLLFNPHGGPAGIHFATSEIGDS